MQQENIILIFCDLEKPYNIIPSQLLLQALGKANLNQSVTEIIRNTCSNKK
jgi:hypothetical protein